MTKLIFVGDKLKTDRAAEQRKKFLKRKKEIEKVQTELTKHVQAVKKDEEKDASDASGKEYEYMYEYDDEEEEEEVIPGGPRGVADVPKDNTDGVGGRFEKKDGDRSGDVVGLGLGPVPRDSEQPLLAKTLSTKATFHDADTSHQIEKTLSVPDINHAPSLPSLRPSSPGHYSSSSVVYPPSHPSTDATHTPQQSQSRKYKWGFSVSMDNSMNQMDYIEIGEGNVFGVARGNILSFMFKEYPFRKIIFLLVFLLIQFPVVTYMSRSFNDTVEAWFPLFSETLIGQYPMGPFLLMFSSIVGLIWGVVATFIGQRVTFMFIILGCNLLIFCTRPFYSIGMLSVIAAFSQGILQVSQTSIVPLIFSKSHGCQSCGILFSVRRVSYILGAYFNAYFIPNQLSEKSNDLVMIIVLSVGIILLSFLIIEDLFLHSGYLNAPARKLKDRRKEEDV
ncbi:hypothetical protein ADUPG1_000188 [Aduncisulcus paluster]|uniref:Major facilitator superfamily (MFS) profile domain-containing protein n=1 Tax=Aduncisulcus paluster TaxID=2918883 RepID=A0ABQ5K5D4_9EUKA|nr:hypothetical protein ADUPG1_000188 [Aduncisulcus paluster]